MAASSLNWCRIYPEITNGVMQATSLQPIHSSGTGLVTSRSGIVSVWRVGAFAGLAVPLALLMGPDLSILKTFLSSRRDFCFFFTQIVIATVTTSEWPYCFYSHKAIPHCNIITANQIIRPSSRSQSQELCCPFSKDQGLSDIWLSTTHVHWQVSVKLRSHILR